MVGMKLRHLFFVVAVFVFGYLIYNNIGKFDEFVKLLGDLNLYVLILILPIRYASYWTNTRYFASFLALYGHKVESRQLFRSAPDMLAGS